ncbi:uncharacterized protein L969DRAFT_78096 [Mixia osmundae IAM 14324]|uniref:Glycosyltransferase family 69 protein n=1 Tax=Mixia osmundae (strain CBS 9802 / IAM 14324 / JCM 22182 / KY 12970) TaxID=764103 RepID=G7E4Y7_MIXOS|nr:uncharacterized protein L969DRAFT_78096 [Mixia osmundae IAM 14324]KEI37758.1 hypothetical protein L969DRAFT_78096 [Mixia osmundae IAM 14324]GAA97897.1 hypothetical protein E5Q_04577 [Mixia osmundae IAM 14324]
MPASRRSSLLPRSLSKSSDPSSSDEDENGQQSQRTSVSHTDSKPGRMAEGLRSRVQVQRFGYRLLAGVVTAIVLKTVVFPAKSTLPPGEIAHPALLERITMGTPLTGGVLDASHYAFLQSRLGRDEEPDIFDKDISAGKEDFWNRFQKPFMTSQDTYHLDEQVIRGVVDELMQFNGWAAAACSSLSRPFGVNRREDEYSDLTRPGALYYFGLVIHTADHFVVDQLATVIQMSRRLGPQNVFVSIIDYGSTDSTPFLCDLTEAILLLLSISFRIRHVPPMTHESAAAYYPHEEAYTRNLALEPLHELHDRRRIRFARVIWLKGFTCPTDLMETLRISAVNHAAMTCSMDWKEHNGFFIFNDRWRTRDMEGNLFRGSKSTSSVDEAPPRDTISAERYGQHLPFQVFCCESGTHVVDPAQSYYAGLAYRSSVNDGVHNASRADGAERPAWKEGPCMDSAQMHFCRDLWLYSAKEGVKVQARRIKDRERRGLGRNVTEAMEEIIQAVAPEYALPGLTVSSREKVEIDTTTDDANDLADLVNPIESVATALTAADALPTSDPVLESVEIKPVVAEPVAIQNPEELQAQEDGQQKELEEGVPAQDPLDAAIPAAKLRKRQAPEAAAPAPEVPPAAAIPDAAPAEAADPVKAAPEAPHMRPEAAISHQEDIDPPDMEDIPESEDDIEDDTDLAVPNDDFVPARILVNPRCVTTYAGVSHIQLALDLFGSADEAHLVLSDEPKKSSEYLMEAWRGAPENFVCQEMTECGGRASQKQQRRTSFYVGALLKAGWQVGHHV